MCFRSIYFLWHKQAAPSFPNMLFYCELIKWVWAGDANDIDWSPAGGAMKYTIYLPG